jgi:excisionase family DNA binding protein
MPRKSSPIPAPRPHYVSPAEAADYLGVNERTVRRMVSAGKLPGYRLGRLIKVDLNEVDSVLEPIPTVRKDRRQVS